MTGGVESGQQTVGREQDRLLAGLPKFFKSLEAVCALTACLHPRQAALTPTAMGSPHEVCNKDMRQDVTAVREAWTKVLRSPPSHRAEARWVLLQTFSSPNTTRLPEGQGLERGTDIQHTLKMFPLANSSLVSLHCDLLAWSYCPHPLIY